MACARLMIDDTVMYICIIPVLVEPCPQRAGLYRIPPAM